MSKDRNIAELHALASKLRLSVEIIDPETAEKWLATAGLQRPKSAARVAKYAAEMESGLWRLNGESIVFDDGGCLFDGQHRLHGVIKSGVTIASVVVRGVPRDWFWSIDQGGARTGADVLGALDEQCHNTMAACIGVMWRHETGALESSPERHQTPPKPVLIQYRDRHGDEIRRSVRLVAGSAKEACRLFTGRVLCYAHILFSRVDPELANEFVALLNTPAGHDHKSPILAIRERMRMAREKREKLYDGEVLAGLVRACVDHRRGSVDRQGAHLWHAPGRRAGDPAGQRRQHGPRAPEGQGARVSRREAVKALRHKLAWLDLRLGELIPGSSKHNSMMRERVAVDLAARELESRPHQVDAARLAIRVLRDGDPDAAADLGLWAEGVLADEEAAKRERRALAGGGA